MKLMTHDPRASVASLVNALNIGDIDAAESLYLPEASFFPEPGKLVIGRQGIRSALSELMALKPTLTTEAERVVISGDVALYMSRWSLKGLGPDGTEVHTAGQSCDVLCRQSDGSWLIAIDNPYGSAVLAGV